MTLLQSRDELHSSSQGAVFQIVPFSHENEAVSLFDSLPDVVNSKTAAGALSIPENSLRELARSCEIRGFKVGKTWRFTRTALIEYVRRKERDAFSVFGGDNNG